MCVYVEGIDIQRAGISSVQWGQGIEICKEFAARSCSECYCLLWHLDPRVAVLMGRWSRGNKDAKQEFRV